MVRLIPCAVLLLLALPSTIMAAECASKPSTERFFPATWGIDSDNTRFVSAADTSINAQNVHQLELKWAYGLSTQAPRFYPLVTPDTIYIGDGDNGLLALDRESGCERWRNEDLEGGVASSIVSALTSHGPTLLFTDRQKGVFAVHAESGVTLWQTGTPSEPLPMYSGSPLVNDGVIYVPISSQEIALSINPFYGCCTTSGGMAAFDIETGKQLWYLPTIEEPAQVTGSHYLFVEEWGPSGAPVWSAPTLDRKRGLLFYGTGENYTAPATDTSDAIFAVDAATGKRKWVNQFTANDTFNMACVTGMVNCPEQEGPDLDFGASPLLSKNRDGRELLFVGQKSGTVSALDPTTGVRVWSKTLGRGGYLGGIHWGLATDPQRGLLYVPISDFPAGLELSADPTPGMYALNSNDGAVEWFTAKDFSDKARAESGFWPGLSAAIVAAEGIVVAGDLAGQIEVYDASNGEVLWRYKTATSFTTVNDVTAQGGSIDSHGPLLVDDLLLVSSGYSGVSMQGGNAFLVFQLAEQTAAPTTGTD
jgi:polyvinyl alcohol dehydrogenase (cytochrome)